MTERVVTPVPVPVLAVLRRFLGALLFAGLLLAGVGGAIYRQDVVHQRDLLEQQAEHLLALQQELLLFEFRAVQSDLLYLASQATLTRFLAGEVAVRRDVEQEHARFAQHKAVYDQIRFLDTLGNEMVRINYRDGCADVVPQDQLQSKATRYYYQQALSLDAGEVFVSPLDLNVEYDQIEQPIKPVIRFLTPVFDGAGQRRGLLVLNYLGAHLLAQLKQIAQGFPGESMLINPMGEYLQAPDPRYAWGWQLGHPHSFRGDFPEAWSQGRRMSAGKLQWERNLFLFRRVSPASPSGRRAESPTMVHGDQDLSSLILVANISSAVAEAPSRKLLNQLLLMCSGVMAVVALLSFYWARSGVIRRYHERQIGESESRLRQLSSLLLAAQESERRNLSRDLHDELGQQVTAIRLDLRSLDRKGGEASGNPLLQRAIQETDQLLGSLHQIAMRVRPSVLDDLGLQDAVESFLADYQQRTGIRVDRQLRVERERVSATVGENVYRVLQEALANVAKHSRADEVEVVLVTDDQALHMTVRDRGVGLTPEQRQTSARLGILGMRERVELLNGQFELSSSPGRGTTIRVCLPLE